MGCTIHFNEYANELKRQGIILYAIPQEHRLRNDIWYVIEKASVVWSELKIDEFIYIIYSALFHTGMLG